MKLYAIDIHRSVKEPDEIVSVKHLPIYKSGTLEIFDKPVHCKQVSLHLSATRFIVTLLNILVKYVDDFLDYILCIIRVNVSVRFI